MKEENLLIVFVKNAKLGHAKTRLAASIGDQAAFEVYKTLLALTERETRSLEGATIHIYFSSELSEENWAGQTKFVQHGADLGERMRNAFQHGFDLGFKRIIGVGSDLPDLNQPIMQAGLDALTTNDAVFGPAEDGGYYLIGMNRMIPCIFENKPWSQEELLTVTLHDLKKEGHSVTILQPLNDIDTLEDLRKSSIAEQFSEYIK